MDVVLLCVLCGAKKLSIMTAPMGISFRLISYSTHGCEVTVLLAASAFAAGVVIAFTLCRTGT